MYAKSIDFWRKISVHHLDSNPRPHGCKSAALPIYMAVVFDGMLPEFFPLPAAERKLITALPRGEKLQVGG